MASQDLIPVLESRIARALRWAHQHPRRIGAGVLALLAGFTVTAFGVVAPLAPDASNLPQRTVTEAWAPADLDAQLDALAAQPLTLSRNDTTRPAETVESLVKRLGIVDADAEAFLRSDAIARRLFAGRAGKLVAATTDAQGRLQRLVVRYPAEDDAQFATHFSRLTIARGGDHGFSGTIEQVPLQTTTRLAAGVIRSSLFAATDEANIPDPVATQMAEIFSTDIDFHRELRKGDTFEVVYEALTADGEPVPWNQGAGRVLAAEFTNGGHPYSAVWFSGDSGKGAYFDLDGRSKHRAFLASPLEFSRVTSGFSMRFHPILQQWKKHEGVDYGAPIGTPVRVVGDGVVAFAGVQNGFGNVIHIRHANNRETVYAHLSRIDVRVGQKVEQGQHIGAVGMTGWATGPHLHFEFHVDGVVKDPLAIAKTAETLTLDAASRPRFAQMAQAAKSELAVAASFNGHADAVRD